MVNANQLKKLYFSRFQVQGCTLSRNEHAKRLGGNTNIGGNSRDHHYN